MYTVSGHIHCGLATPGWSQTQVAGMGFQHATHGRTLTPYTLNQRFHLNKDKPNLHFPFIHLSLLLIFFNNTHCDLWSFLRHTR